jgi:hypothetical protein
MRSTLLLFALACSALAAGEVKPQGTGVNAATVYREAFAAMPKLDAAEERKLFDARSATPTPAERALVVKAEPALKLAAEASRVRTCDWNLNLNEGPMLALPHLGLMQNLAALALLKARLVDPRTAVEQHEMVLRMARHTASTPLLLSRLVGISIEAKGMTSIASMLPSWDAELRHRLRLMIKGGLDPAPSVSDCVVAETKGMSAWFSNALEAEVKKRGASFSARAWLEGSTKATVQSLDEALKQSGQTQDSLPKDAAEARQMIVTYRTQMLEFARILALPSDAMDKEAAAFEQKLKMDTGRNFLTALMAPPIINVRMNELKAANMTALMLAAFDVQARGESALPAQLATYRKTNGGFELTGKELFKGKPFVLTVGPK